MLSIRSGLATNLNNTSVLQANRLTIEQIESLEQALGKFQDTYIFDSFRLVKNYMKGNFSYEEKDITETKSGHCYDVSRLFCEYFPNLDIDLFGTQTPPHVYAFIKNLDNSIYILDVLSETKPILIQTNKETRFHEEKWSLSTQLILSRFTLNGQLIETTDLNEKRDLYQDIILNHKLKGGVYAISKRDKKQNLSYIMINNIKKKISLQLNGQKIEIDFDDIDFEKQAIRKYRITKQEFKPCQIEFENEISLFHSDSHVKSMLNGLLPILNQQSLPDLLDTCNLISKFKPL